MRDTADELARPARWPLAASLAALGGLVLGAALVQVQTVVAGVVEQPPDRGRMTIRLPATAQVGDEVDVAVTGEVGRAVVTSVTTGQEALMTLEDVTLESDVQPAEPVQIRMPGRSMLSVLVLG